MMIDVNMLKFDKNGLLTGIVQDVNSGAVLMVAMMNLEAVEKTIQTGTAHFWSRSRRKLWQKGESSGNFMHVRQIKVDCDMDALLMEVEPQGPACHTGEQTCFYRKLEDLVAE
jgi:phosphoribosyl-AMP cyclohydrolase